MPLAQQIEKEYVAAYKSGDAVRLGVLRLLKTAMKNRLVELKRPHDTLSDDEVMEVIFKQAKQRQDSIEQYTAAKRKDLAEKEAAELAILREYLPQMLEDEALIQVVEDAIADVSAAGPQDTGKVIGTIMSKYKGRVDGKAVSAAVKKRLAK